MEMATHSSTLAWRIPWTEEPGRLQSMELQKLDMNWATFTHDLNSTMTVLIRPHRAKGRTNYVSLSVCPEMRKKVVLSSPSCFFYYKRVALFVLGATELPCLPACINISHKHPMLTNSLCHFASYWILAVMRQRNPSISKFWHQVSGCNQKTVGSSPFLVRDHEFKSQTEMWVGSSPSP